MKLTVFFLLSIAIAIPSHASGRNVDLSDYIDLGTMKIGKNTETLPNVVLPYIKPEGITETWTPDEATLYIEKLIVDGKRVGAGIPNWGAAYEIYAVIRDETVPTEEETREFDMVWSEYGLDGSQPYITYLVYGIGRYQTPRTYVIEYGAKEVFMAYSFTYPETSGIWKRYFQRKPEGIERKFHVKWTIEWEPSG